MQRTFLNKIGIFKRLIPAINMPTPIDMPNSAIDFLGKNKRRPKRANHGARPCSHVMRRLKRRGYYQRKDVSATEDPLDYDIKPLHREGTEVPEGGELAEEGEEGGEAEAEVEA